jgi:hypothetical protein
MQRNVAVQRVGLLLKHQSLSRRAHQIKSQTHRHVRIRKVCASLHIIFIGLDHPLVDHNCLSAKAKHFRKRTRISQALTQALAVDDPKALKI